jgi:hypothetical protein
MPTSGRHRCPFGTGRDPTIPAGARTKPVMPTEVQRLVVASVTPLVPVAGRAVRTEGGGPRPQPPPPLLQGGGGRGRGPPPSQVARTYRVPFAAVGGGGVGRAPARAGPSPSAGSRSSACTPPLTLRKGHHSQLSPQGSCGRCGGNRKVRGDRHTQGQGPPLLSLHIFTWAARVVGAMPPPPRGLQPAIVLSGPNRPTRGQGRTGPRSPGGKKRVNDA